MNYLAHAYLSFNEDDVLIGNMIADYVKGKAKFSYPAGIQKGISLHRAIDEFTDSNPATIQAKQLFRPAYRLYAGAFMDIVYDHFLAIDVKEFTNNSLEVFSNKVYETLEKSIDLLPLKFQKLFPYMKAQNWLYNYQYDWGLEKSFQGLVRRAKYIEESNTAFEIFNKNYKELQLSYNELFPALKSYANKKMGIE
jgi:acyl carrier protein phosphodiesterase